MDGRKKETEILPLYYYIYINIRYRSIDIKVLFRVLRI
jgi:hypothetical protein